MVVDKHTSNHSETWESSTHRRCCLSPTVLCKFAVPVPVVHGATATDTISWIHTTKVKQDEKKQVIHGRRIYTTSNWNSETTTGTCKCIQVLARAVLKGPMPFTCSLLVLWATPTSILLLLVYCPSNIVSVVQTGLLQACIWFTRYIGSVGTQSRTHTQVSSSDPDAVKHKLLLDTGLNSQTHARCVCVGVACRVWVATPTNQM